MLKNSSLLIERHDLIKSLRKWRVSFFLLLGVAALLFIKPDSINGVSVNSPHIARIQISGFIDLDHERLENIQKITNNDKVKAVILDIDSGGGTVVGGETLYYAIRDLSDKKPVISYFGNQATSAAYMIALATNYIVSPEGAVTGSVGVLAQAAEFTALAQKLGIKPIIVKSSTLKAVPHPAEKITPDGLDSINNVVSDIYDFFLTLVLENRADLSEWQIVEISTGKIFTGRQALDVGLIDDVGDFSKVRVWLNQQLEEQDLKIVRHNLERGRSSNFLDYFYSAVFGENMKSNSAILSYWNPSV